MSEEEAVGVRKSSGDVEEERARGRRTRDHVIVRPIVYARKNCVVDVCFHELLTYSVKCFHE
jgi:hypothetical protein